jgi:long-subunit fatty acid transport protein
LRKIILVILLIPIAMYTQSLRNYSNEFLNIGVDASAFGMGKAVTSTTNDVNAIYWNPAGLTKIEEQEASLMHAEYFKGIAKYDYIAYA